MQLENATPIEAMRPATRSPNALHASRSAPLSAKLLKRGQLKTYPGFPHGMATTHADIINADLLAFIREGESSTESLIVATPTMA